MTLARIKKKIENKKKTTATPRACFVCSKPTTVCLATTNAVDFLYTCEAHLSDSGFATELVDPASASKAAVSKEEIARVKAEWEAKEAARKKAKEKAKEEKSGGGGKDVSTGDGEGKKEGDGSGKNGSKSPSPPIPGGASSPSVGAGSGATTPMHKRYSLHRDFYAMRQAEHRRKRQTKQMQELAPRLPGAPRSFVG
jgi:hypothetical protein